MNIWDKLISLLRKYIYQITLFVKINIYIHIFNQYFDML